MSKQLLQTVHYFSGLTGFSIQSAKQILRRYGKRTGVIFEGEFTYLTTDLDTLAEKYLHSMKPIQDNEINRYGIMEKYRLTSKDIAILVKHEGFPRPVRKFVSMSKQGGMYMDLWDITAVGSIDLDALIGKKRLRNRSRNIDYHRPFEWSGIQAEIIFFLIGDYKSLNEFGRAV